MVEAVFAAAVDDIPAELEPIEVAVVAVPEEDLEVELVPVPDEEGDDDSETEEDEEVVARPAGPDHDALRDQVRHLGRHARLP